MALFGNPEPQRFDVADVQLHCEICKNELFWHRNVQLHGAVASFFDMEWLSPNADCFVCAKCGYIHWFLLK